MGSSIYRRVVLILLLAGGLIVAPIATVSADPSSPKPIGGDPEPSSEPASDPDTGPGLDPNG